MSAEVNTEWLTPLEAAELLRVDRVTIYRWIKSGELPAWTIGSRNQRLCRSDVIALLKPVTPRPQTEQ
jgi:excisionase family DNA binding protein